jgi:hypothetical protein
MRRKLPELDELIRRDPTSRRSPFSGYSEGGIALFRRGRFRRIAMSDTRQHVHKLIDQLPPAKLNAVAGLLEVMIDREETSEEEERAVNEAKHWLQENGGKGIPQEEVLADFGLSPDDFRRMGEERAQRRRG